MVARAINDGRVFDLPLSPACFQVLRKRSKSIDPHLSDVAAIDRTIAASLHHLLKLAAEADDACDDPARRQALADSVKDADLVFTLPGRDDVELVPGGATKEVTLDTLSDYCTAVAQMLTYESVSDRLQAFGQGFCDTLPSSAMFVLSSTELSELAGGQVGGSDTPLWTREEMEQAIVAEHGYVKESPQVVHLIDVICHEFSPAQQSRFLEFCTGCPRLPIGGLRVIGKITVVKKDVDAGMSGSPLNKSGGFNAAAYMDPGLPSVNTCFKYLKLPPYPTKEELKDKLLLAVLNAGDSFDLS
jgi:E3 ubiquitin-protein ligase TRIP12